MLCNIQNFMKFFYLSEVDHCNAKYCVFSSCLAVHLQVFLLRKELKCIPYVACVSSVYIELLEFLELGPRVGPGQVSK